jgi:transitional endoplasmic reticulum ATPase
LNFFSHLIPLANRIVFGEQRIDFVYLGQSISFRVEQPTDDIDLIDSLHSLSLDSNLPSFYRICPSTTSITIQFEPTTANNNIQDKSISLSDIGGLKKEKSDLTDLLRSSTINYIPPRGILLHGPKGCGKTILINAIIHEISATPIRINSSDIYSRHYGESETKLKRLFAQTTMTKNNNTKKKYLLIVENIESLCPNQERVTQQLERRLTTTFIELLDRYLDGETVLLIATTNRLESVDTDLRRPGRIDEEIEIGIPNQQDRLEVKQNH